MIYINYVPYYIYSLLVLFKQLYLVNGNHFRITFTNIITVYNIEMLHNTIYCRIKMNYESRVISAYQIVFPTDLYRLFKFDI